MIGAIIGDIVGSPYEFHNHKSIEFPLFINKCHTTDDSICTSAIAEKFVYGGTYENHLSTLCSRYISKGYGRKFASWVEDVDRKPYSSWGNGAAMRVSPVGWWFKSLDETVAEARESCECTHNHQDSYDAAGAVAGSIFMLRNGSSKHDVYKWVSDRYGYDLDRKLDDLRPAYKFEVSCRKSVPEAFIAFMEGNSFEEVLRFAVSLGGDSDTICAIAGSLAEAHYAIPADILISAVSFIEPELLQICNDFIRTAAERCK